MSSVEVTDLCVISNTEGLMDFANSKVNGWQKHNENEERNIDFVQPRLNYEIADTLCDCISNLPSLHKDTGSQPNQRF